MRKINLLIDNYEFNFYYCLRNIFSLYLIFVLHVMVYSEGSKDLYPAGAYGGRAALRSTSVASAPNPFPTEGTHYVYAKAGETISMASSARGAGYDKFRITTPNGTSYLANSPYGYGNILNRTAELAGPRLPGQGAGGNRYIPIYYTVPTTGIYRVDILSGSAGVEYYRSTYTANGEWVQNVNGMYIMAWDISVANAAGNEWIKGRVYSNVLNMDIETFSQDAYGNYVFWGASTNFHGNFKVLTNDGYVYNVENNGNNGGSFTFMVNNKGFYETDPSIPSYESKAATTIDHVVNHYHSPKMPDSDNTITHKIFYNVPAADLPSFSNGAVPGGSTWLKNEPANLNLTEVAFVGVDGVEGKAGTKGGYFVFESVAGVEYTIDITPVSPANFTRKVLTGYTETAGENRVYWDATDGDNMSLPAGSFQILTTLRLKGAEVHFPFIDMEINPNGLIIELLDNTYTTVVSDEIYWNDTPIYSRPVVYGPKSNPANASQFVIPQGTSSNSNGHKWGSPTNRFIGSFGDEQAIDTWTFIQGDILESILDIDIRIADLSVTSITTSSTCVANEGEITYQVKAKNDGPTNAYGAPFSFILPDGFTVISASFDGGTCGTESLAVVFDSATNTFKSEIDLPNGCEITYTFTIKLVDADVTGNAGVTSTIMRPFDYTDPDATYPDINTLPEDPFVECQGDCNNILSNNDLMIIPTIQSLEGTNATACEIDGIITLSVNNIADGTYNLTYDGGMFENIVFTDGNATITGLAAGEYNNIKLYQEECVTSIGRDVAILAEPCVCTADPYTGGQNNDTNIGISTLDRNTQDWVTEHKNGFIKLESSKYGFVPTRLTSVQRDAIESATEGMVIWNTTTKCLELYDGEQWKCTKKSCNK